ncbi:MAG: bifunctional adenosylcobinamide kinase/adenosylcobinamide-phosphate guanylyltransferase [Pseudomonadota bacterium]
MVTKMLPKLTFVLGGAASGKSVWSENLLLSSDLQPVYIATSRVLDAETKFRVDTHKARRKEHWVNFEAECNLLPALQACAPGQGALVDCATMWLTNQLMDEGDLEAATSNLCEWLNESAVPVIVVSNEVGHGIVPENALARQFREAQGRLNIALAAQADLAVLVAAGIPLVLKGRLP